MNSLAGTDGGLSESELAQVAGGKDDGINAFAAVASIVMNDAMAGIYCQGIGFHD